MLQSIGQRLSGSRAPKDTGQRNDAGFTLNELVWALFLLGVVATAALGLFLNGMTSVSNMQRQQSAASLAATALDTARAVTGTSVNSHGTSGLIKGRTQLAVLSQWDELNAVDPTFTADMTTSAATGLEAWDVAPGMTQADQWVPIQVTQTVDNQEYTVDTLIGPCFRLKTAPNMGQACTASRSSTDDEVMYRVRVVVRWDPGSGDENVYTVSTLVDPSADPVWNTALMPFAFHDEFTVVAGHGTTFHNILSNDTFESLTASPPPIVLVDLPAHGTAARGTTDSTMELVYFTPPSDVSGTVTFTYRLRDTAGQESDEPATVTVHIVPDPTDDDFTVEPNSVTVLNDLLLGNDVGVSNISTERETRILPFLDGSVDYFATEEVTEDMLAERQADKAALEAKGVFYDDDGNVWFEASDVENEVVSFSYYLMDSAVDGFGAKYPNKDFPASVAITTASVPLEVVDGEFDLTVTSSSTWNTIDWRGLTGNSDDVQIKVVGVSNGGDVFTRVDGDSGPGAQGDQLEFETLPNNLGEYEIEYVVVSPAGNESDTGVFTVTVAPAVSNQSYTVDRGDWSDIDLASLGLPAAGTQIHSVTVATCGSVTTLSETEVRYSAPTNNSGNARTCTFTYRLASVDSPDLPSHQAATITITVPRG